MASPLVTLLLILPDEVVRGDRTRSGHGPLTRIPRPLDGELVSAVEAGLARGAPGKVTYVLVTELWTQMQNLPVASTVSISKEELSAALAFEAEALSGMSPLDTSLGFRATAELGDERQFWLTQIPQADREAIEQAVKARGSRLGGLLHPGGVPAAVHARGTGQGPVSWARVELWPESVVAVVQNGGPSPKVHVVNDPPETGRWSGEVATWLADHGADPGHTPLLVAPGVQAPAQSELGAELEDSAERRIELADDPSLTQWLEAWEDSLAAADPAAPVLRPPRPPASGYLLLGAGALAFLVVAGLVGYDASSRLSDVAELEQRREQAQRPAQALEQIEAQLGRARTRRRELSEEQAALAAELATWREALSTQRARHRELLGAVAAATPEGVWISALADQQGVVTLSGWCQRSSQATALANALARRLSPAGWRVDANAVTTERVPPGSPGRYWFELQVRSTVAGTQAPGSVRQALPERDD